MIHHMTCPICQVRIPVLSLADFERELEEHRVRHMTCTCRWIGYNDDVITDKNCPEHGD